MVRGGGNAGKKCTGMMDFGMVWGFISIIGMLAVVGIALLIWCFRGKRIGDHPVCRRCDFDLTGLPKESGRCPECGADLSRTRAIRIGHRHRRPVLATLATLMILPVPGGVGAVGWLLATGRDLSQYEPASLLRFSALHLNAAASDAALRELMSRAAAKKLTRAQVDQVVADALAIQADDRRRWSPLWGDFIEGASWLKMLSDEDWSRYYVRLVETSLVFDVRAKVRRGDVLPLRFSSCTGRGGTRTSVVLPPVDVRLTVDGGTVVYDRKDPMSAKEGPWVTGPRSMVIAVTPWKLDALSDGPHTTTLDFLVTTPKYWRGQRAQRPLRVTRPWRLVSADVTTVTPHDEPDLKPKVAGAIRVVGAVANGESLVLTIDVSGCPVDVSFLVFARYDGIECQLGSFAAPASPLTTRIDFGAQARKFTGSRMDLILRSDPRAAVRTIDVTQFWVGQIELKEIAVKQKSTPPVQRFTHSYDLATPPK